MEKVDAVLSAQCAKSTPFLERVQNANVEPVDLNFLGFDTE
jgi:hypothetical protein